MYFEPRGIFSLMVDAEKKIFVWTTLVYNNII